MGRAVTGLYRGGQQGPQGQQWERCQSRPAPPAPFPPATLTLGQVTAVIKIDLVSGEEGETRRPSDLGRP